MFYNYVLTSLIFTEDSVLKLTFDILEINKNILLLFDVLCVRCLVAAMFCVRCFVGHSRISCSKFNSTHIYSWWLTYTVDQSRTGTTNDNTTRQDWLLTTDGEQATQHGTKNQKLKKNNSVTDSDYYCHTTFHQTLWLTIYDPWWRRKWIFND